VSTVNVYHPVDLEPALVDSAIYSTRRRRSPLDASSLLSLLVMLLFIIPVDIVVPQLTALGRPALMLGMVLAVGWLVMKLHPRLTVRGPQPMRWVAVIYLVAVLLSYASGSMRGMPELEMNAADRYVIYTIMLLGIMLTAADGLADRSQLDTVIRTMVWCGGVMALIGLVEFVTAIQLAKYIVLPGLASHHDELLGFENRGDGFFRVASTAQHYIEFSSVMAVTLPFAIHTARFARRPSSRMVATVCAFMIAAAIPVTLSRTGIVALGVAGLVMFMVWPWRVRFNVMVLGFGMTLAMMAAKPGLLGTIKSLFSDFNEDPSIQGRTDDYQVIFQYFAQRPLFGRGPGTFVPVLYFFLDNEWLMHLVTMGIIGVAALAVLHLTAMSLAVIASRRSVREEDKHLCACIVAGLLISATVAGTFDSFSFSTFCVTFFLVAGFAGAMWRLTHPDQNVRSSAPRLFQAAAAPAPANVNGGQPVGAASAARTAR
jgi:O-antigen ligase